MRDDDLAIADEEPHRFIWYPVDERDRHRVGASSKHSIHSPFTNLTVIRLAMRIP